MFFSGLLLLFILLPIVELALLLKVGELLGWLATLLLVVATGVLGVTLARMQGLRLLVNMQQDLAEGRMPAPYLLDGLMILVAGALLITPGLLTDAAGFLLLVPAFRGFVKVRLRVLLERKLRQQSLRVTTWEW